VQIPLVLTLVGADRPGRVEQVARVVADLGGNWLESRLCRLGGQFAGIVRVLTHSERRAALTAALHALASEGLTVEVFEDAPPARPPVSGPAALLELVGQDRPGIVRQVAAALAARGVNVEELATECVSAPMSGETLFKARARLQLPEQCDVAALRAELERIAADLLVDLTFEPLGSEGAKT
jgi:glycine cleavage system regulatory protein